MGWGDLSKVSNANMSKKCPMLVVMNNMLVAKKSNMWKFDCLKREEIHYLILYISEHTFISPFTSIS